MALVLSQAKSNTDIALMLLR